MLPSVPYELATELVAFLNGHECVQCNVQVAHVESKGLFCGTGCCNAFVVPRLTIVNEPSCLPNMVLVFDLFVDVCGPNSHNSGVEFVPSSVSSSLSNLAGLLQVFNGWFSSGHTTVSGYETSCNSVVSRFGWDFVFEENNCYRYKASVSIIV